MTTPALARTTTQAAHSAYGTTYDPHASGRLVLLLAVTAMLQFPNDPPEHAVAQVADDVRMAIGQEGAAASARAGRDQFSQEQIAFAVAEMLTVLEFAEPLAVAELRSLQRTPRMSNPSTPEGQAALYAWVGSLVGTVGGSLLGSLVGAAAAAGGATGAGVALAGLGVWLGGAAGARYGVGRATQIPERELRETKNYATFGALLMPWFGVGAALGGYLGPKPNPAEVFAGSSMYRPTKAAAKQAHSDVGGHVSYVKTSAPASWKRDPNWEPRSERTLRYTVPGEFYETIVAGFKSKKAAMDWAKKNNLTVHANTGSANPASNPGARETLLHTEWPTKLVAAWGKTGITAGAMADSVIDTAHAAGWTDDQIIADPRGAMLEANEIWETKPIETGWADPEYVENPARKWNPEPVTIRVSMRGGSTRDVPAEQVTQHIVVHPSIRTGQEVELAVGGSPSSWGVTHGPTGALVATVGDKKWAKKLAEEIEKSSGPGIGTLDVAQAQRVIGGPNMRRAQYIGHVSRQSGEPKSSRGKFPTFRKWSETAHELDENPSDPEGLKERAAVAAAVGSIVGGVVGVVLGAVVLGGVGALAGGAAFGAEAGVGGGIVGAVYGIPLGGFIGSVWGAVRQTGKALGDRPGTSQAKLGAGVGDVFLGPIGAGLGAYLGAPG